MLTLVVKTKELQVVELWADEFFSLIYADLLLGILCSSSRGANP